MFNQGKNIENIQFQTLKLDDVNQQPMVKSNKWSLLNAIQTRQVGEAGNPISFD